MLMKAGCGRLLWIHVSCSAEKFHGNYSQTYAKVWNTAVPPNPHNKLLPKKTKLQEDRLNAESHFFPPKFELYIIEKVHIRVPVIECAQVNKTSGNLFLKAKNNNLPRLRRRKKSRSRWRKIHFSSLQNSRKDTHWDLHVTPCVALEIPDLSSVFSLQSPWRWLS